MLDKQCGLDPAAHRQPLRACKLVGVGGWGAEHGRLVTFKTLLENPGRRLQRPKLEMTIACSGFRQGR